jgi:hypothetical protein
MKSDLVFTSKRNYLVVNNLKLYKKISQKIIQKKINKNFNFKNRIRKKVND